MVIDLYADLVCPWCCIGARRLARALAQRPQLQVARPWRPFQLQPAMPKAGLAWSEFVESKFGGRERARSAFARVTAVGAADGIEFDYERIANAPNTRDAHRLVLFAAREGREWELADALFAAYFARGRDLGDHEHLADAAVSVGLSRAEVLAYLASDEGGAEVDASQQEAYQTGMTGVPFYVLDGRYALSGAQPVEVFLRALDLAREAPSGQVVQVR
jgi:predicted DsbA family dithiol-disulfide isomerase